MKLKRATPRILTVTLCIVLLAGLALSQQSNSPDAMLRAAMDKEIVDGDLKSAIEQYKKIAEGKDRAIAARALLRMAGAYQKLGDAEAQKVYARIAKEFDDQKAAASEARTRLASLRPANTGMVTRELQVNTALSNLTADSARSRISPDGRYVIGEGDFALHDLVTGMDRPLDDTAEGYVWGSSFSRDGKQVAYTWWPNSGDNPQLRLVNLQGAGVPPAKTLVDRTDIFEIEAYDWTSDNKWIAVNLWRNQSSQIGLVSTADGSIRVLKSMDWRGHANLFLTPDGKYMAYDRPVSDTNQRRAVFVLALDTDFRPIEGNREEPILVDSSNKAVMGWSPDGEYLLFASERSRGSASLWALPFADGKAKGSPRLIKSDIGRNRWA